MEMSVDRVLGIVGAVGVPAAIGAGLAMDTKTIGEVRFAQGCFITSALVLTIFTTIWAISTEAAALKRGFVVILIFSLSGLALVESLKWAQDRHEEHEASRATSLAAEDPSKALKTLFQKDFPDTWGFGFAPRSVATNDGNKDVPFEARLLIDPISATKFVAIYIPPSQDTYLGCERLADHIDDAGGLNLLHLQALGSGSESVDTKNYKFSGRVFIYHESYLSPEQKGVLHHLYEGKGMDLELRGQDYERYIALQKAAAKAGGSKQP